MGTDDDVKHAAEEMKGRLKEATGSATGDESMEAEGKTDQLKADVKRKADDAKDALEHAGQQAGAKVEDVKDKLGDKVREHKENGTDEPGREPDERS